MREEKNTPRNSWKVGRTSPSRGVPGVSICPLCSDDGVFIDAQLPIFGRLCRWGGRRADEEERIESGRQGRSDCVTGRSVYYDSRLLPPLPTSRDWMSRARARPAHVSPGADAAANLAPRTFPPPARLLDPVVGLLVGGWVPAGSRLFCQG